MQNSTEAFIGSLQDGAATSQMKVITLLFHMPYWLATDVELSYDPLPVIEFSAVNWHIPLCVALCYLVLVFAGPILISNCAPFDLKFPLAAWNGFLFLFSVVGMCRTVPHLIAMMLTESFRSNVCTSPLNSWFLGPVGFWAMLFNFSKIFEMLDTAFIVLRKKPLIFLHWYHHLTVMLFCWNAYQHATASGLFFLGMNYCVHSIMYGYYMLAALGVRPKWFPPLLITALQIVQMVAGTALCLAAWYFRLRGDEPCHNDPSNLVAGILMYASYFYLFCRFALERYNKKQPARAQKKID